MPAPDRSVRRFCSGFTWACRPGRTEQHDGRDATTSWSRRLQRDADRRRRRDGSPSSSGPSGGLFGATRATSCSAEPIELLVPERFRAQHPLPRARQLTRARSDGQRDAISTRAIRRLGDPQIRPDLNLYDGPGPLRAPARSRHHRAQSARRSASGSSSRAAPNAMIMTDEQGRIVLANFAGGGAVRLRALSSPACRSNAVPERLRRSSAIGARFFADPATRAMGAGRDLHALHKDGTGDPRRDHLNPLRTPDSVFVPERGDRHHRAQAAGVGARAAPRLAKAPPNAEASAARRTVPDGAVARAAHAAERDPRLVEHAAQGTVGAEDGSRRDRDHRSAMRHQTRIVSDILDVSRIIRGRFHLEIARCDRRRSSTR